jgi:hypothetical protein
MKLRSLSTVVALTCAFAPLTSSAAPGVNVIEAAKIAQDSLKERGNHRRISRRRAGPGEELTCAARLTIGRCAGPPLFR